MRIKSIFCKSFNYLYLQNLVLNCFRLSSTLEIDKKLKSTKQILLGYKISKLIFKKAIFSILPLLLLFTTLQIIKPNKLIPIAFLCLIAGLVLGSQESNSPHPIPEPHSNVGRKQIELALDQTSRMEPSQLNLTDEEMGEVIQFVEDNTQLIQKIADEVSTTTAVALCQY